MPERQGCGLYEYGTGEAPFITRRGYQTLIGDDAQLLGGGEDTWAQRIHPEDRPGFLATKRQLKAALAAGSEDTTSLTYRVRHTDGRWIWVSDCSVLTKDATGNVRRIGSVVDITAERLAQEALRASEERFRLVAAAMQGAVYDHDLVNHTTQRSGNYPGILGLAPEAVPSPILPLVHPADRAPALQVINEALESDATGYYVAYRLWHAEGRWVHVESRGVILRDAAGRAIRRVGSQIDVTARLEAEAALRRSETRLRLAQDAAGIGMFELDFVARKRTWSPEMFRMLGLPPDTPVPAWEEGARYYTEEYSANSVLHMLTERDVPGDHLYRSERRAVHQVTGELRHLLLLGRFQCNEAGEPLSLLGLQVDVTELRQAEQRARKEAELRSLGFAAAEAGWWEWDMLRETLEWSAETFGLFGRTPAQQPPAYAAWPELVHPQDRARMVEAVARTLRGPDTTFRYEYRVNLPEPAERWVLTVGSVVRDGDGKPQCLRGLVIDITDRRIAEARQALLAREVNHRAKNALAVVSSLIRFTRAETVAAFRQSLEQRIAAMGRAHALLAEQAWSSISLALLLQGELDAYSGSSRCRVAGPDFMVAPTQAQAISLVFHEFTTNAAKCGGLSQPNGQLEVSWALLPNNGLELAWSETGCENIQPPSHRGFGTRLIETTIRHQLDGTLNTEWRPFGVLHRLRFGGKALAAAGAGMAEAPPFQPA